MSYYYNLHSITAETERAERVAAGIENVRSGAGVGVMPGGTDVAAVETAEVALQQVAAGMLGAAGPREFQAGIEAGHREFGNRAFLRWVEEWQGEGRGQATRSLPGKVTGPLQLMPKKK